MNEMEMESLAGLHIQYHNLLPPPSHVRLCLCVNRGGGRRHESGLTAKHTSRTRAASFCAFCHPQRKRTGFLLCHGVITRRRKVRCASLNTYANWHSHSNWSIAFINFDEQRKQNKTKWRRALVGTQREGSKNAERGSKMLIVTAYWGQF